MHTMFTTILLTSVVMAQADQMSDATLKKPPHKHHLYIFHVTSEASVDDLKVALSNFTIDESYKVIGESRLIFVIKTNDTDALRSLTFPAGSTVMQHPVEHFDQYVEMFGIGGRLEEKDTELTASPDRVLLFFDSCKIFPETMCPKAYEMEVKGVAAAFSRIYNDFTIPRMYPMIASYPSRWLSFVEMEENVFQNWIRVVGKTSGGIEAVKASGKRVVRV